MINMLAVTSEMPIAMAVNWKCTPLPAFWTVTTCASALWTAFASHIKEKAAFVIWTRRVVLSTLKNTLHLIHGWQVISHTSNCNIFELVHCTPYLQALLSAWTTLASTLGIIGALIWTTLRASKPSSIVCGCVRRIPDAWWSHTEAIITIVTWKRAEIRASSTREGTFSHLPTMTPNVEAWINDINCWKELFLFLSTFLNWRRMQGRKWMYYYRPFFCLHDLGQWAYPSFFPSPPSHSAPLFSPPFYPPLLSFPQPVSLSLDSNELVGKEGEDEDLFWRRKERVWRGLFVRREEENIAKSWQSQWTRRNWVSKNTRLPLHITAWLGGIGRYSSYFWLYNGAFSLAQRASSPTSDGRARLPHRLLLP